MLYTIAFITNQQLRDVKLEGLLNPDFVIEKYIHEGLFDFSVRINQRGYFEVWSTKTYKDKSIQKPTKWKTIRGAEVGLKKVMDGLKTGEKRRFAIRDRGNDWSKNDYIPVICDITDDWNKNIEAQIENEKKSHQAKLNSLIKKLAKK